MSVERRTAVRRHERMFMLSGDEDGDPEVSRLEAALEIDPSDLSAALAEQPALYYRARLMAARLEAVSWVAEAEVDAAVNRVAAYLREQARDRAEPPTDAQVLARARQHADVDKLVRRALETRRRLVLARALEGAYAQRARILGVMGAMASIGGR